MDREGIISEISQTKKDKYHIISHTWNLNNQTRAHRYREQTGGGQRLGVGLGEIGEGGSKRTNFQF